MNRCNTTQLGWLLAHTKSPRPLCTVSSSKYPTLRFQTTDERQCLRYFGGVVSRAKIKLLPCKLQSCSAVSVFVARCPTRVTQECTLIPLGNRMAHVRTQWIYQLLLSAKVVEHAGIMLSLDVARSVVIHIDSRRLRHVIRVILSLLLINITPYNTGVSPLFVLPSSIYLPIVSLPSK